MRTKSIGYSVKPLLVLGSALFLAGLAAGIPANAATTDSSTTTTTHKPLKKARTATRHQKKMISKTDPSAVHSNATSSQ